MSSQSPRWTLAVAALAVTACSGGDDGGSIEADRAAITTTSAPGSTTTPSCAESPHLVVFDISGTITDSDNSIIDWLQDPADEPEARNGAPELVQAYAARGYQIVYYTILSDTVELAGRPVPEALMGWLGRAGFPTENARVETTQEGEPLAELASDLMGLNGAGTTIAAAYADEIEKVRAFETAGAVEVYLIDEPAALDATTIPGDDLVAQRAVVDGLPKACE